MLLNRRPDATERLVQFAETVKKQSGEEVVADVAWRNEPVEQRLSHSLVKGIVDFIETTWRKPAANTKLRWRSSKAR